LEGFEDVFNFSTADVGRGKVDAGKRHEILYFKSRGDRKPDS
jgi:hypothetical protein